MWWDITPRHGPQQVIQARLAAAITFLGQEDSEEGESGPFTLAALYLANHPELAVTAVNWQSFEDADGSIMYRLDVEVTPPHGYSILE